MSEDLAHANALLLQALCEPSAVSAATSGLTDYLRLKATENGFSHKMMKIEPVAAWRLDILEPSVRTDYPILVGNCARGIFQLEIRRTQPGFSAMSRYCVFEMNLLVKYEHTETDTRLDNNYTVTIPDSPTSDFLKACAYQLDRVLLTDVQRDEYAQELGWYNV